MKNLRLQSNVKFYLIFLAALSGIFQTSCSFFGDISSSRTKTLTKEEYQQGLTFAQNLQKNPSFKKEGIALEKKFTQVWNQQQKTQKTKPAVKKPATNAPAPYQGYPSYQSGSGF